MAGRRLVAVAVGVVALAVGVVGVAVRWSGGSDDGGDSLSRGEQVPDTSAAPNDVDVSRPRGGTVRVAVWGEPDPEASTLGGAAVRALVLPQLFVPMPDGSWAPSLVEPGSDRLSTDGLRATFRLREGAEWSDGTPITVDDLRRSADERFVASVSGPAAAAGVPAAAAAGGRVTVRFTQPLPGWRRLWSGGDAVSPPAEGVWGGPFVVAGRTPGLEVVLRRNERWWGPGPFLDEVRLVLVPEQEMAFRLFERGSVDVVMPMADTARVARLSEVPGASVDAGERSRVPGGWWVGMFVNAARLSLDDRRAVVATVDRALFVGTLLKEEARALPGFAGGAWAEVGPGDPGSLRGDVVSLVGTIEEPMTELLQRSMQRRVRPVDGRFELRNAEAHQVEAWLAEGEYGAAIAPAWDPPGMGWTCRWADAGEEAAGEEAAGLARDADAGDAGAAAALEELLRDQALLLPLWQGRPVVAWRGDLHGPEANVYALSGAWNAWTWWRDGDGE